MSRNSYVAQSLSVLISSPSSLAHRLRLYTMCGLEGCSKPGKPLWKSIEDINFCTKKHLKEAKAKAVQVQCVKAKAARVSSKFVPSLTL